MPFCQWHASCLREVRAAIEKTNIAAAHNQSARYEKVSFRFDSSCSGSVTAQSKRSSALGLLPSLLWVPPRLLAPLLARWLLVRRFLASWLLVRWSSGSRRPVLIWPHRCGSLRGSLRNFNRGSLLHGVVQPHARGSFVFGSLWFPAPPQPGQTKIFSPAQSSISRARNAKGPVVLSERVPWSGRKTGTGTSRDLSRPERNSLGNSGPL
jgi:hypothetical protein